MKNYFLDIGLNSAIDLPIHTLGGIGTSSEYVANFFRDWMKANFKSSNKIYLHDSYESAAKQLSNEQGLLIVANAYSKINYFYMDAELDLLTAFIHDTPLYGLATDKELPNRALNVASHPAPIPIIKDILPADLAIEKIIYTSSTSEAAQAVTLGKADVALTNEIAIRSYGLKFISQTRTINMLWSVFISKTN